MKRPQFSLRTIFVLIALISIPMGWSAYQLNRIRQRHDFLKNHTFVALNYGPTTTDGGVITSDFSKKIFIQKFVAEEPPKLPWGLRLFGEEPLNYSFDVDQEYADQAKSLFPEATIYLNK